MSRSSLSGDSAFSSAYSASVRKTFSYLPKRFVRLSTLSHCLVFYQVVYSKLVRGRFSDRHKVGFPTISRSVFRIREVPAVIGSEKLYLRQFHIQTVGLRKIRPFQKAGCVHVRAGLMEVCPLSSISAISVMG